VRAAYCERASTTPDVARDDVRIVDPDEARTARPGTLPDDRWRAFLDAARSATLATTAPSGRPRLVPICFVVGSDDPAGRVRLYSPLDDKPKAVADPHRLARVRDILTRPVASLLVDRWSEDWEHLAWLRLETSADVLEPAAGTTEHRDAVAALRAKYPQYADHRLDARPVLRFTVERVVAWGDPGPANGLRAGLSDRGRAPRRAGAGNGSSSSPGGSRRR
jgi:PPOX class probable F420-dependent enzyme